MERSRKIWKALRWLLLIGAGLFAIAQFIRPAKTNPSLEQSLAIEAYVQVDPKVAAIFERSCVDCHSNKTRWPWYSHVAPVSWFVTDHVNHGRSHLNLSEWGSYDRERQRQLLKQSCGEVKSGAMPLSSYTPLHPGSKLTLEDVKTICDWSGRELLGMR
jgi:Haem-binding domain